MKKIFSITIYLKDGEKYHTDFMTYSECSDLVEKLKKNKEVYQVWKKENDDENSTYLNEYNKF